MSGNPTGSNVVPMPKAPAAAAPQMPMPMPAMWGGGGTLPWGPGCCPPGGMDALMKCYCDVQAATAFICSVMVQCIQQNPAVTEAIIAAIEASGSSLPLIGVTNGSDAQPGQVGEWVRFEQSMAFGTGATNTIVSLGVLQPGDWSMSAAAYTSGSPVLSAYTKILPPRPPGFTDDLVAYALNGTAADISLVSSWERASITVPTLIVYEVQVDSSAAGSIAVIFTARRMR